MGAHRGNRAAGLYGGLRVKKNVDVSGDVNVTGDVTTANLIQGGQKQQITVEVPFDGGTGNGGAFNWEAPVECLVTNLIMYVEEAPTTSRNLDAGGPVATAGTNSDTLIDGGGTGTTDGVVVSSLSDASTNGEYTVHCEAGEFITGTLSAALAGDPVIHIYLTYLPL